MIPSFTIQSMTFFTSSTCFKQVCIYFSEFMPLRTVGFSMYFPSSFIIFSLSYRFEVLRINAQFIFAQMINMFVFRYMAFKYFIRNTMCPFWLTSRRHKLSIASRRSTRPNPTSFCFHYQFKKSLIYHLGYLPQFIGVVNAIS